MKFKDLQVSKVKFAGGAFVILSSVVSYSDNCNFDNYEGLKTYVRGIRFFNKPLPYSYKEPEIIYVDSSAQTISLNPIPVFDGMPVIKNLVFDILYPTDGNDYDSHVDFPTDYSTDKTGDFFHVRVDKEDGKHVIKIDFKANASGEERTIQIQVNAGIKYENCGVFGRVAIVQKPYVEPVTISAR